MENPKTLAVVPNGRTTNTSISLREFPQTVPGVPTNKVAVFRASKTGDIIRKEPTQKLAYALGRIQTTLGIVDDRLLSDQELIILTGFVQEHFGSLTLADLSQAANLLLLDELTTRDGKPFGSRDHYQNLSVAFVSTWLKAYQRYRSHAIRTVRQALPDPEPVRTKYHEYRGDLEFRVNTVLPAWNEWQNRVEGQKLEFEFAYPEILRLLQDEGVYTMEPARKIELFNLAKQQKDDTEQDAFKAFVGLRDDTVTRKAMCWAMREIWDAVKSRLMIIWEDPNVGIRETLLVGNLEKSIDYQPIIDRLNSGADVEPIGKELIFRAIYQYENA